MRSVILFSLCLFCAHAQEFDVASVKINRSGRQQSSLMRSGGQIVLENVSLRECIAFAYGVGEGQDYALTGPAWLAAERFDISAKVSPDIPRDQMLLMIRALLAERFGLKLHRESREMTVYSMVVTRGGPKLKPVSATGNSFSHGPGHVSGRALSMSDLADRLSGPVFKLGLPVLNSTGLSGTFDFTLDWTPDDARVDDASKPSIFTAIQEQLGLKLERSKGMVQVWVVDHAERVPVGN